MDLLTPRFPTAEVVKATDGFATPEVLRNWIARGLFSAAIPPALAGKPRTFPLLAVYNAEMLAFASQRGLLGLIPRAWGERVSNEMDQGVGRLVDDAADLTKLAQAGKLHEFASTAKEVVWAILLETHVLMDETSAAAGPRTPMLVGALRVGTPTEIAKCLPRGAHVTIPVTRLVRDVNKRLGL